MDCGKVSALNEKQSVKRAALYLRVSTGEQTVENQRQALEAACEQRGWQIVVTYADEGISGSKGRDKRPGFDAMLKDATRGRFDVLLAWSVDRLGRSLPDLVNGLQELHGARVDLFLHQQALDTTMPAGWVCAPRATSAGSDERCRWGRTPSVRRAGCWPRLCKNPIRFSRF